VTIIKAAVAVGPPATLVWRQRSTFGAPRHAVQTASRDDLNQAEGSLAPIIYLAKMDLSLSSPARIFQPKG
jgi:hypothetical protein